MNLKRKCPADGVPPFIINKTIQHHPLRSKMTLSSTRSQTSNLTLEISKEHAQLHSQLKTAPREKILTSIEAKLTDNHHIMTHKIKRGHFTPTMDPELNKAAKDNISEQAETSTQQERDESAEVKALVRIRGKVINESPKRLRSLVYESLSPYTMDSLYSKYIDKQAEGDAIRRREEMNPQVEVSAIKRSGSLATGVNESFMTKLVQDEEIDLKKMLGVDSITSSWI